MTKNKKVGMILGADIPDINLIGAGWQQGIRHIDPSVEDLVVYAQTFADPSKGKELALSLYGKGCDIVSAAAGGTGHH